jgi:hypothetical protein
LIPVLLLLLLFAGCGTPFRVPDQVRMPVGGPHGRADDPTISVIASILTDEDEMLNLFRANMRLARLLPVYVEMKNNDDFSVELRRIRIEADDSTGTRFAYLESKQVITRLYDYYGIRFYPTNPRKEFEARFKQIGFDWSRPLTAGENRRGYVFFELPRDYQPTAPLDHFTITFSRMRAAGGEEKSLKLVISPATRGVEPTSAE